MQPNKAWNSYGTDGDLVTDELGNTEYVKHKTRAIGAAQKAEKVNLEQRALMCRLQRLHLAGDDDKAWALLEEHLRGVYGPFYGRMVAQ